MAFPVVIVAIVLVGVGGIAYARNQNQSSVDAGGAPSPRDHWHDAYGVFLCDHWADPLSDAGPDRLGIHTHEDGLIHVHPAPSAAGRNATLGKFFDQTGLSVSEDEIRMPDDRVYREGETTCNGKPGQVRVIYWRNARAAAQAENPEPTRRIDGDFGDVRLDRNGGAYTFAFVAEGTDLSVPPSANTIAENVARDGGDPSRLPPVPGQAPAAAPPGSTPPGSAPPGSAPPSTAPPSTAPPTSAPPGGG